LEWHPHGVVFPLVTRGIEILRGDFVAERLHDDFITERGATTSDRTLATTLPRKVFHREIDSD
jgi:hypothetical protein